MRTAGVPPAPPAPGGEDAAWAAAETAAVHCSTRTVLKREHEKYPSRRTLQQVIDRYPYSSSASSAKAELERIKF
jgi:hypothetical protein